MDTIEGGKWLSNQQLAWTLVNKAVERIHELENELGCFFDRNADGTIHQKAFAGQTLDRAETPTCVRLLILRPEFACRAQNRNFVLTMPNLRNTIFF